MIEPPPPAIMCGSAARLSRKAPLKLMSSTRCQSARLVSITVPLGSCGAAPCTRMSRRPKLSYAASATARVAASLATSQACDKARPPASVTRRAVSAEASASTSQHATAAPSRAKATAIARQMPPPAPPIRAAFPASCIGRLRSQHHGAAIDGDGLAGDKTAGVGNQPQHRAGEIRGLQIALDGLTGLDGVQRPIELRPEELSGP